jgi:hypothetical protein
MSTWRFVILRSCAVSLLCSVVFFACGGRTSASDPLPDGFVSDGATGHDSAVGQDASRPDAAVTPDAAVDQCTCPEDRPVYQFGECVPPLQYGCEATACTPNVTDCGEGFTCLDCAAAACCICEACLPTCIFTGPAQGPLPEYLKIFPTFGPALEEQTISIEGFPFYIGALFYLARVGESGVLMQGGGGTCSFDVTVPGQPVGMVPVWVSQYGGGDPWVLAGFYTWSTGDYPSCVQPGFLCGAPGQECCQTTDVPMACVAGRCRRQ